MERQLRATVIELLSRWLSIFATCVTIPQASSRWRYARFRGYVNGKKRRVTLVRLTTLSETSASCPCGGRFQKPSKRYSLRITVTIQVERQWRAMLERLLLKLVAEKYGIDYSLSWQMTRFTPIVLPISQTKTRWPEYSQPEACSAPSPPAYTTSTSTDASIV